jgi:hypothetical protein
MHAFFIAATSILTLAAAVPYLLDTLKGKTKPRIVSWLTWSVLTGIATAAAFSDHQYGSAILTFSAMIETLAIAILGFIKTGDRSLERLDIYCLIGAGAGLALWWLFNSPAIAVMATVTIDFIGFLPTIKHAWEKPYEETWLTFLLAGGGGAFAALVAQDFTITALAFPLYDVVTDAVVTAMILMRRMQTRPAKSIELAEALSRD